MNSGKATKKSTGRRAFLGALAGDPVIDTLARRGNFPRPVFGSFPAVDGSSPTLRGDVDRHPFRRGSNRRIVITGKSKPADRHDHGDTEKAVDQMFDSGFHITIALQTSCPSIEENAKWLQNVVIRWLF